MSEDIDIKGLDKPTLLAALYNNSFQQGMGIMHARGRERMTTEQAAEELKHGSSFDYLHGRVMKVNIGGDTLRPYAYDRDVGSGQAAKVVAAVRSAAGE